MSRAVIATALRSQEYRQDLVESFYMRYLDRNADRAVMTLGRTDMARCDAHGPAARWPRIAFD